MKSRNGHQQRNKVKHSKNSENCKPPLLPCRQRAQSLPPPESPLLLPAEDEVRRHSDQPILSKKELVSLRKTVYLHDSTNTICNLKKGHKMSSAYYGCPVEVLSPRFLPLEERTALVSEMEGEFLNMRKVFITGLPPDSTKESLSSLFSELNCVPVTAIKDKSVRVVFPSNKAAQHAITLLHSSSVNCHYLMATQTNPDSLLFVGNLPLTYTRQDLKNLFSPYGELLRCLVVYSPETGRNKGYGFVEYMQKEEAVLAKQQMATKVVGLRSLRVDFADNAMMTVQDLQSETLFVDRLPKGFQEEGLLREKFENYGTVNFCQVALGPTGISRGFAFVDMGSSEEAEHAQLACNGCCFAGQEMRVSFGMPCRRGACILQHKPNKAARKSVPQFLPPLLCQDFSLKGTAPFLGHWRRGSILHAKSEENLQTGNPMKPHPLLDTTNMHSDGSVFGTKREDTLTQLCDSLQFQQKCLCQNLSTPSICTHTSSHDLPLSAHQHKDTVDQLMEEEDHTQGHTHTQEAMPLQDRACSAPHHMHPLSTLLEGNPPALQGRASPPPSHSTTTTSSLQAHSATSSSLQAHSATSSTHFTLVVAEAQLLNPLEEEEEESPMPGDKHPRQPVQTQRQPTQTEKQSSQYQVETLLGKRQSPFQLPSEGQRGWSMAWGCGEEGEEEGGVYDQPYIGQHQQGIPFTHPLKRIRMMMELC